MVSYLALTIGLVAIFLAQQVGTSGGEVRHTEIRANATTVGAINNGEEKGDED